MHLPTTMISGTIPQRSQRWPHGLDPQRFGAALAPTSGRLVLSGAMKSHVFKYIMWRNVYVCVYIYIYDIYVCTHTLWFFNVANWKTGKTSFLMSKSSSYIKITVSTNVPSIP